jgi:hypothetical protein
VARALDWALARRGDRSYAGRCLAFVEDAFERANQIEVFGEKSAAEAADAFDLTPFDPADPPPAGALVFYACGGPLDGLVRDWGHVGIALGDGPLVHAWDEVRVDAALEVPRLQPAAGWTAPRLIGWAAAAQLLRGHRPRIWDQPPT